MQFLVRFATVATALFILGCSSSTEVNELRLAWQKKIAAAVPAGTPLADAKRWLESQGAKPYPARAVSDKADPVYLVASIRAREWYCESWLILVTVRTFPDDRVRGYDIASSGVCL